MKRMVIGYGLSAILGIALGMLFATNKFWEDTLGRLVVSLQSLPSLCWMPLAILWFGLNEKASLFVVVMGSLLSVTISTETGLKRFRGFIRWQGETLARQDAAFSFTSFYPRACPTWYRASSSVGHSLGAR